MSESGLRVRLLSYLELNPTIIACWDSLGERALEPNAFLSPCFVMPALRHLCSETDVQKTVLLFVDRPTSEGFDIVGAGIFFQLRAGLRLPFPCLKSFLSVHSYLSGFLLDRDHGEVAVRAIFDFLCNSRPRWHGVDFPCMYSDGTQAELVFRVAREFGCTWHELTRSTRAVFVPAEGGDTYLQANLSARSFKKLRQARARLERKGKVEWRALFGTEVMEANVESFLDLEHMGWKGKEGVSLRSSPSHVAFFQEMVDGFRRTNRLFFTELMVDGTVIASTSNLVSGGVGFAFKIGWHPDYADVSPGRLNELAFVQEVNGPCRDLSYIDSGAEEGSFIEQIWSGRRTLTYGTFSLSTTGEVALQFYDRLRSCKAGLEKIWERTQHLLSSKVT